MIQMLSPADFIFNDYPEHPYYVESQYLAETNGFQTIYLDPVAKITNPYPSSENKFSVLNLTNNQLSSIYQDQFALTYSKQDAFPENSPYFPGVRFLSPGIVVFERPPTYQIVDLDHEYRDNINDETSSSQYYIPIPWQVYVCVYNPEDMRLHSVKMFFADSFLSDINQTVYCPPLFNFYSNGNLCRPFFASMEDIEKYPQDINGIIASAYDWVWNSGFNFDITENIAQFLSSKKFEQFEPWAETKAPKSVQFLIDNPIYGLPRITHKSYFQSLFKCWESVPLDQISNIVWSNYTQAEFYYQEINNVSSDFFYTYVATNGITLCEDYDEDSDEDEYEHYCEDCMSADAVRDSEEYRIVFIEATKIPPKSIGFAIQESINYAKNNRLVDKCANVVTFQKSFIDIYKKYVLEG